MGIAEKLSLFSGKKVLVTGDTGFKGSWLSYWLTILGADVYGLALPPEQSCDLFHLLSLHKKVTHLDGDIRDFGVVEKFFCQTQPEFVFHLAAQPIVRRSYMEPKTTWDTNVGGSLHILEAVRKTESIRSLVYITSDKCYRNQEWTWGYRESDELGGRDPYSASKAAAEILFSSYLDSFLNEIPQLGAASVRAGNVIGGGDWAQDRIVPDCMKALMKSEPILVRNPKATRPWQHVLEPLSGYLFLATKLYENPKLFSGAWNFGPNLETMKTVQELVRLILLKWGSGELKIQPDKNAPHEAGLLHLNCDKAHSLLPWHPTWNFDQTVTKTVDWYHAYHLKSDMEIITQNQIKAYMEALV